MERMTNMAAMNYWKLGLVVVAFIGTTSYVSKRAHESNKLSRTHVLKYSELLREAARASVQSTQDQHPVQSFINSSKAMCAINIVNEFLSADQVKHLMNIDLEEMKSFISKQHDEATSTLVESYTGN